MARMARMARRLVNFDKTPISLANIPFSLNIIALYLA